MKSFIKLLEKRKSEKLDALRDELTNEYELELKELTDEKKLLENSIKDKSSKQQLTLDAQKDFDSFINKHKQSLKIKRDLVKNLWEKTVNTYYQIPTHHKDWLQQSLVNLPELPGNIIASKKSAPELKKLIRFSPHKLTVNSESKDTGFIFESPSMTLDARLSTYIQEKYPEIEIQLMKLFSKG